jgi:hypothetical protein
MDFLGEGKLQEGKVSGGLQDDVRSFLLSFLPLANKESICLQTRPKTVDFFMG